MYARWIPEALSRIEANRAGLSEACVRRAREILVNCEDFQPMPEILCNGGTIIIDWPDIQEICVFPSGRDVCSMCL